VATLQSSVAPSLASAYTPSNDWLSQDVTNPTGKGPAQTGPVEPIADPVNGTAPVDLNGFPLDWQEPELATAPPDYFYESAFPAAGPWPALAEEWDGKEPLGTLPDDGITPAGYYKVPAQIEGLAQRPTFHPGHDRHSQDVDNAGWEQYTASGRTAVVQYWEQDYPGVDNFWPVTQPNMAIRPQAIGGNQEINGVVAQYGDLANSGGDTAYSPGAPAPVTTVPPGPGTAAPIPQWGF